MPDAAKQPRSRSSLTSFFFSKSVWTLAAVAVALILFMVLISGHDPAATVLLPIAGAVLTFTLVGVWFETPWVLRLLAHAFLSGENVVRLSEAARQELRKQLQTLRAQASGDPAVVDLAKTLAESEPDFLDPYAADCTLVVKHAPLDDTGTKILATTEFRYTAINPRDGDAPFGPLFHTIMHAMDGLPEDAKLFTLVKFQIHDLDTGRPVIELGPADVVEDPNKDTGTWAFSARADDALVMAAGERWRVVFASKRIVPYHDVFKYTVSMRCVKDMQLTYEYGPLKAKCPDIAPKLWLFTHSAKVLSVTAGDDTKHWDLRGWLLRGNGFALSW